MAGHPLGPLHIACGEFRLAIPASFSEWRPATLDVEFESGTLTLRVASMSVEQVRVGALHIPLLKASSWVASYVDAEKSRTSTHPFAYPAYDHFVSGSRENELNYGDLLAPALLNVRPSISTFLGLQAIRGYLEEGLVHTAPSVTLASAIEQGDLHQRMDAFVGILDGDRPRGIKLTTLTKILHRKRPGFMPLHDKFVAACYQPAT